MTGMGGTDFHRHLTTLAMLKRLPELTSLPRTGPATKLTRRHHLYSSPFYAPHGDFTAVMGCRSAQTVELVIEMYHLTQVVTNNSSSAVTFVPNRQHHQIYDWLQDIPSTRGSDWVHESIRLAALIYTKAILHHTSFSSAANVLHEDPTVGDQTTLCALLIAVEHTEVTGCWDAMRGIFLWVCLIGGAAAWGMDNTETGFVEPRMAWARKCFSLWSIRAVVGVGFEYTDGIMDALKTGLKVRNFLDGRLS